MRNMTGRSKSEKCLSKGVVRRHLRTLRDNIQQIIEPGSRIVARGIGVKRISSLTYEETGGVPNVLPKNIIRAVVTYTEHEKEN